MSGALIRIVVVVGVIAIAFASTKLLKAWSERGPLPTRFDLADAGLEGNRTAIVEFSGPYCYECKEILPLLKAAAKVHSSGFALIDTHQRPDIASKYNVRSTPTVLVVSGDGRVKRVWQGSPEEAELERALSPRRKLKVA